MWHQNVLCSAGCDWWLVASADLVWEKSTIRTVVLFESVRLFVVLVPLKTKERMCTLGTPVSYAKSLKQTSHHVEITPLSYKSTPRKESSLSGTSSHSPPRRPMMDLAQPNLPCRDPNKHAHLQVLFLKKMQQWQRDRAKPVANRRIWKPSGGRSSKWKNMPARCHLILAYLPFLFFFPWVMARWIGKETRSGRGLFHKHTKDLSALSLPL